MTPCVPGAAARAGEHICRSEARGSLTAAVSTKTYWLPRYVQAKAAATVMKKLNMVMTTALTERTGENGERQWL